MPLAGRHGRAKEARKGIASGVVRPGKRPTAKWEGFGFEAVEWRIPAQK